MTHERVPRWLRTRSPATISRDATRLAITAVTAAGAIGGAGAVPMAASCYDVHAGAAVALVGGCTTALLSCLVVRRALRAQVPALSAALWSVVAGLVNSPLAFLASIAVGHVLGAPTGSFGGDSPFALALLAAVLGSPVAFGLGAIFGGCYAAFTWVAARAIRSADALATMRVGIAGLALLTVAGVFGGNEALRLEVVEPGLGLVSAFAFTIAALALPSAAVLLFVSWRRRAWLARAARGDLPGWSVEDAASDGSSDALVAADGPRPATRVLVFEEPLVDAGAYRTGASRVVVARAVAS